MFSGLAGRFAFQTAGRTGGRCGVNRCRNPQQGRDLTVSLPLRLRRMLGQRMTENEMATLRPHVITPACPSTCIERQLPVKACQAVRRHLEGEHVFHPAVCHVVAPYQQSGPGWNTRPRRAGRGADRLLAGKGRAHSSPRPHRAAKRELEPLKRLVV